MRHALGLIFTAVILLNLTGFYTSFMVKRNNVRASMRREIGEQPAAALQQLELSLEQYKALTADEEDEVVINGEYYDVKQVAFTEHGVTLLVKHDGAETELVKKLIGWVKGDLQSDKGTNTTYNITFAQQDFYWQRTMGLNVTVPVTNIGVLTLRTPSISNVTLSVNTPPPDFILA